MFECFLCLLVYDSNVGIAIVSHPPVITINGCGSNHKKWVVYGIAILTLHVSIEITEGLAAGNDRGQGAGPFQRFGEELGTSCSDFYHRARNSKELWKAHDGINAS